MEILCPVSLGEALDKISILRIKLARIQDADKVTHIRHELERLSAAVGNLDQYRASLDALQDVNSAIWDIEDAIRRKEKSGQFDADFIALARSVYVNNDKRFAIKNQINQQFQSSIQEQKSYEKY